MIPGHALGEIRAAYERCQRRYPTVQLALEGFTARVESAVAVAAAGKPSESYSWLDTFAELHHEDLFLAAACAVGDRIAWEHFADDFVPLVRRFAARACQRADEGEDLAQEIIAGLMPGAERGRDSRLTGYSGRGSLSAWLRVTVAHAAVDRFRRARVQVSVDELEEQGSHAPELATPPPAEDGLDAAWGPVLARLLEAELRSLPARDRLLLVLYYVQGVPLKTVGRHFAVHEATASRWLEEVRQGIRKRIERELRRKHGLRPRELDGLWRRVSERDLSPLEKMLASSRE